MVFTTTINTISTTTTAAAATTNSNNNSNISIAIRRFLATILLSILSALCFSFTAIIAKQVTDVSVSQLALFRYIGKSFIFNQDSTRSTTSHSYLHL